MLLQIQFMPSCQESNKKIKSVRKIVQKLHHEVKQLVDKSGVYNKPVQTDFQ